MNTITKILLTAFCCVFFFTTQARHILGGTSSYKVIAINGNIATIEFKLYVYRDANAGGANFDTNLPLGIYRFTDNEYDFISTVRIESPTVSIIEIEDIDGCNISSIDYELGIYVTEIELELSNFDHYKIAYQRCCRDNTITNIVDPDAIGIAISMDIYPAGLSTVGQEVNTQFEFPTAHEVGTAISYDFLLEDDFDKLYNLTTPKAAGGVAGVNFGDPMACDGITPNPSNCLPDFDEVLWVNQNHPYGLNSTVELNEETGELSADIPEVGKTLVGLTIDRFTNGELASKIRHQFLINTIDCSISNTANQEQNEFRIAPNPTNGFLTFSSTLTDLSVLDLTGKVQPLKSTYKTYENIDLGHLENGLYYLKGKTLEGQPILKKVLVVK